VLTALGTVKYTKICITEILKFVGTSISLIFLIDTLSLQVWSVNLSGLLIGKTTEVIYEEGEGPQGIVCNLQL